MFDQLSAEILASLIKGFPRTTRTRTTTKQNVDPAVHFVYSRVKICSLDKIPIYAGKKSNFAIVSRPYVCRRRPVDEFLLNGSQNGVFVGNFRTFLAHAGN
jgi:hypothetical protein